MKMARILSLLLGSEKKINFHCACSSLRIFKLKNVMLPPGSAYHRIDQLFGVGVGSVGL